MIDSLPTPKLRDLVHTMEEPRRSKKFFMLVAMCVLIAGGVYFVKNFKVAGLDGLAIHSISTDLPPAEIDPPDDLMFVSHSTDRSTAGTISADASNSRTSAKNLRIGSWALSGFGPSKLGSEHCRLNLIRMIRKYDVIALQQITARERDVMPRIVDEINEGGRTYDFVLGQPTGPADRPEQLAILFNVKRVHIDRSQTYTVADPQNRMTYDPMVAWFRAAEPSTDSAWTFSIVNVRINLTRAAAEVALLPSIFSAVRSDGRGEDDVVMLGLFQADDSYLVPQIMGADIVAAVRSTTTDIFHRHQTCNILIDQNRTSEYIGRGGPVDFLRVFNLNLDEAEAVSSHLPIFAEFSATEGGAR